MNARPDMLQVEPMTLTAATGLAWVQLRAWSGRQDLPAMADVYRRSMAADRLDRSLSRSEWDRIAAALAEGAPELDLLLVEAAGEVIGSLQTLRCRETGGTPIYQHAGVLVPEWRRRGVGAAMLSEAHRRLRQTARQDGAGRSAYLQVEAAETQHGLVVLLLRQGYAAVRHLYQMVRPELDQIPEAPLPEGAELRPALPEHFEAVWEAQEEAARDRWGHVSCRADAYREWLEGPACRPDLWQIAWAGDRVVGVALADIPVEENAALRRRRGVLRSLAVRREWRRRGLGRALALQALACLRRQGMSEAALVAEAEDRFGTLRLFGSLGFRPQRRSTIYRRPLHGR